MPFGCMVIAFCLNLIQLQRLKDGPLDTQPHSLIAKYSPLQRLSVSSLLEGGTNTAIPHMVALEYRNTASKFSQIPKPQLQMGKS